MALLATSSYGQVKECVVMIEKHPKVEAQFYSKHRQVCIIRVTDLTTQRNFGQKDILKVTFICQAVP